MLQDEFTSREMVQLGNTVVLNDSKKIVVLAKCSKQTLRLTVPNHSFEQNVWNITKATPARRQESVNTILMQLMPYIHYLRLSGCSTQIGFIRDAPFDRLRNYTSLDQDLNRRLLVLNLLRSLEFSAAKNQTASGPALPVKVNLAGLQAIKQVAHQLHVTDKDILKVILFEAIDAASRTLKPYSLEQCIANIELSLRQLTSCMQMRFRNGGYPQTWNVEVVRQTCDSNTCNDEPTALLRLLLGTGFVMHKFEDKLVLNVVCIPMASRNSKSLQQAVCMSDRRKPVPSLGWFCSQFINWSQAVLLAQRNSQRRVIRHMRTRVECFKCCREIVEEVVTTDNCRIRAAASISLLQTYLKGLSQFKESIRRRNKLVQFKCLQRYLRAVPNLSEYSFRRQHTEQKIVRMQKYIRCYLTRQRQLNQLRIFITEQQRAQNDLVSAGLLTTLLNKNNEAKPFEAVAYVQLRVLWIKNLAGSPVFDCVSRGLSVLDRDMDKRNEKVQSIHISDTNVSIQTDRRSVSLGIQTPSELKLVGSETYEWRDHEGLKRNLPIVAKSNRVMFLIAKNRELYCVQRQKQRATEEGQFASTVTDQPERVSLPGKVRKVSCGLDHTVCLTQDNQVYYWGMVARERRTKQNQPLRWQAPQGIVLDIECSSFGSFALMDSRQIWDVLNNLLLRKQDNHQLIPFQLLCMRSLTLEVMIVKSINFSHTRLSLKDRKEIARVASLKTHDKGQLFKIPFDDRYSRHFPQRCLTSPTIPKHEENTDPNLLLEQSLVDLTFSDCSI